MSLPALFLRFGIAYFLLLLVAGAVLYMLGIRSNSGVNVAVLLAAVMGSCFSFARRNQRYFSAPEKRRVVLGMLAIDLLIQGVFSIAVAAAEGPLPIGPLALALAVIGALHAVVIWFFVGLTGRQFAKQAGIARKAGDA